MNRIVLITGASSGYGKATAKPFVNSGDTVIMTARCLQLTLPIGRPILRTA